MFFSEIYESWREIQYEKYEKIFEEIKNVNLTLGKLILDLGAANGFLTDFISERFINVEIVALDVDFRALKENSSEHKILADGNSLPFKEGIFDTLFCIDVISLLRNLDSLDLSCVKDKGVVILALPKRYREVFLKLLSRLSYEDCEIVKKFEINGSEREVVVILKKNGKL